MTPEKFEELKKDYIDHIKNVVNVTGGMFPHISVIADDKDDQASLIHIPIPDQIMENDEDKDRFIDEILPEIAEKLHKDEFRPYAVTWAAECWMRTFSKEQKKEVLYNGWKSLPKKEIVFVSIETADNTEVITYDIIRKGMKVDKQGDMIEDVSLEEIKQDELPTSDMGGRFSKLFNKFKKK